jgi:hypothetical protein
VTQYPHSMSFFKEQAKGVDPAIFEVAPLA